MKIISANTRGKFYRRARVKTNLSDKKLFNGFASVHP
jgi:hypothetical protein